MKRRFLFLLLLLGGAPAFSGEAVLIQNIGLIDGLTIEYDDWRFNLRMSNTEPLLRLNVESRVSEDHLNEKIDEVRAFIDQAA